jgi:hypothetical protein
MDEQLALVARRQFGTFTRRQAVAAGYTDDQIANRLASGHWLPADIGVYRHASVPPSWRGDLTAACLASGGVASHRAAAFLHGLVDHPVVEVTVARTRRYRLTQARTHWLTDLHPERDVTAVDGIPTTNVVRTLIDLGAVAPAGRVELALERALARRLVTLPELMARHEELARRGRSGVGRLRKVLMARGLDPRSGESDPETRLLRILRRGGLPTPVRQYELTFRGRTVRIDLAYPDDKVSLEYDGIDPHSGLRALEKDRAKGNLVVLAGWIPVHYTKASLRHPDAICREVLAALALARSRGA